MKLRGIKEEIMHKAKELCMQAEKDYYQGCKDCRNGIYDKWYRYNREDDGIAYDAGWNDENMTVMNENIKFIEIPI